jgi:tetratricopeptide (TPR) repeat protein
MDDIVEEVKTAEEAELNRKARAEFAAGREPDALKLCDRLLQSHALEPATYAALKLACFQHQPFEEFTRLLLHRCFELAPEDAAVTRFLFSQYLLNARYRHTAFAVPVYQKVLEAEPDNLSARCALCEYFYRQGDYERVIATADPGLTYNPRHADLLTLLAKAHYQLRDYGKVVTYCRAILAKRPGRVEVQVLLAEVYTQNALTTNEAVKVYLLALRSDPQNLAVHQALFRAYLRKLLVDEAIDVCKRTLALLYDLYEPSSREFRTAVKVMIEEYERAMRRSPGEVALYLITAKLYEYIGHFQKALIYYRTILQFPLDEAALLKLLEFLEKLAAFDVQNPHLYLYLGLLYHKVERYDDAKAAFEAVMYTDLDEREVEDLLVRHDRSLWRYPAVLVILAHHRIVTREILEGLVQTFRQPESDDWNAVLWVLQELDDVNDVLLELRQSFRWPSFNAIYDYVIPIFVNNGSRLAVQLLEELLAHPTSNVRRLAVIGLMEIERPEAAQCLNEAAAYTPHADVRLEIARYYAHYVNEQTTDYLLNMLHDEERAVRLFVVQALRQRRTPPAYFREVLFTEQDPEVRLEIIQLFGEAQDPAEAAYLVHLLNDLVSRRQGESSRSAVRPSNVYQTFKKLIGQADDNADERLLTALIPILGEFRAEASLTSLLSLASADSSAALRLVAIEAIGQIGSGLGLPVLQEILRSPSEPPELQSAAERALDRILEQNAGYGA